MGERILQEIAHLEEVVRANPVLAEAFESAIRRLRD